MSLELSAMISRDERLSTIESLLFHSTEGVRVVELADACQVDRRTIYRDIAKLRSGGVPIYQKRGRFFVSREYYLASVPLNVHELMALFTAVRVLAQLAESQNPHAISALAKLSAALPDPMQAHIQAVVEMLRQTPVDRLHMGVLEKLTRAWREQRWVRLWHSSQPTPVELAPYFLEATAQGQLYVVGQEATQNRLRAFGVRGILRVELLNSFFTPDTNFSSRAYLATPHGTLPDDTSCTTEIILSFDANDVPLWFLQKHPTEQFQLVVQADGQTHLHLWAQDWHVLLPWVRSLGAAVEVIAPNDFRAYLIHEARQLCKRYRIG